MKILCKYNNKENKKLKLFDNFLLRQNNRIHVKPRSIAYNFKT